MLKRVTLAGVVLMAVWIAGFALFVGTLPTAPHLPHGQKMIAADGIVILTGGPDRIQKGFQLFQLGLGGRLFISGVHNDVRVNDIMPKDLTPSQKKRVDLGFSARSTRENAAETALWARDNGIKSFYLVTAHYHLPRSLLEYRLKAPTVTLYPYAVVSSDFTGSFQDVALSKGLFLFKEYNKYLIVLGRCWARPICGVLESVIP